MTGREGRPQRAWISPPASPLRLPHGSTVAANDGNVLPSPRRSHLFLPRPSRHAEARKIPGRRGPTKPARTAFIPPKIKYKSWSVLSQLGMSIYLNELTVLPAACQIFLQQPPHPDTLGASHRLLSPGVFLLLPDSGRFRSFRCLRPLFW